MEQIMDYQSKKNRHVMTMIYMDANTRLKQPANENEELDRKMWCPGTEVGEVVNSPLNPVIF